MTGTIELSAAEVLADEPVAFAVHGARPGELVTVSATWSTGARTVRSEGRYLANSAGLVEPASFESQDGTYRGIDPYGLWCYPKPNPVRSELDSLEPWEVTITASGEGWQQDARLTRRKLAIDLCRVDVASDDLRGIAFLPGGPGPHPGVLLYSGSGGGLGGVQCTAALLAAHGFATLALAYFNYPDLPAELASIPLEYFRDAIDWLQQHAPTAGEGVAVMGASRGGELSLLLAATYPERVAAVVAMVPSGVVWGGLTRDAAARPPAWTLGGTPVPYLSPGATPEPAPGTDEPIAHTPRFEAWIDAATPEELDTAEVPIERFGGPVLMISAEDDDLWPSVRLAEIAVSRARREGAGAGVRHLRYPAAGHAFPGPAGFPVQTSEVHSLTGDRLALGGSLEGNAKARNASWTEILAFLGVALIPQVAAPR